MHNFEVLAANKAWWDSLSEADQAIIDQAFRAGTEAHRNAIAEMDQYFKQDLLDSGMVFNETPDYDAFLKSVQVVYDKWTPIFGKDLLDGIKNIK
ncbi:hypothetical protein SDC9_189291 [bioreactor metagenome]|uniref:Solute-binding protein n=1 Tax=bioreactor metagenome TaxID=1076179 RepID=A0A645HT39_9ZZZZ